jgi:hypothetical protein
MDFALFWSEWPVWWVIRPNFFFRFLNTSLSVIVVFPTKIAHFYFSVQKTFILSVCVDVYSEWPASRGTLKSQLLTWNNTFCPGSPGQNIFYRESLVTNSKFSKIEKCHESWPVSLTCHCERRIMKRAENVIFIDF